MQGLGFPRIRDLTIMMENNIARNMEGEKRAGVICNPTSWQFPVVSAVYNTTNMAFHASARMGHTLEIHWPNCFSKFRWWTQVGPLGARLFFITFRHRKVERKP